MEIIAAEKLKEILRFDSATGKLYWLPRSVEMFVDDRSFKSWTTRFSNKEAFTSYNGNGYKIGRINNRKYFAHRAIWAIEYGEWPLDCIDHINGDRSDNRIENLRHASFQDNSRNSAIRSDNTSGIAGVCWDRVNGKWFAQITISGKNKNLGRFDDMVDAITARQMASAENGFTSRHGK